MQSFLYSLFDYSKYNALSATSNFFSLTKTYFEITLLKEFVTIRLIIQGKKEINHGRRNKGTLINRYIDATL